MVGIKYCYKNKDLFQFSLMRTQCHFDVYLLPRYSNLKMLDVDKILESFEQKMLTSAKSNSTQKALFKLFWKLDINGVKFLALLVQILTWEFLATP